jgi:hypothetical protein
MAQWSLCWALLFPLYLLLVGQVSGQEIVAGVLVAAVAAGSALQVRRLGSRAFRFRLAWLQRAPGLLALLLADLGRVGRFLLGALAGSAHAIGMVRQPFAAGADAPEECARRGLVVLAASFAPNSFAIGIASDALLLHRLALRPTAADRAWPV